MHSEGWLVPGGDPVLMLAGAVGSALGVYSLLGRVRLPVRRARLPRAIALRRG